jgi:hypothetical protein
MHLELSYGASRAPGALAAARGVLATPGIAFSCSHPRGRGGVLAVGEGEMKRLAPGSSGCCWPYAPAAAEAASESEGMKPMPWLAAFGWGLEDGGEAGSALVHMMLAAAWYGWLMLALRGDRGGCCVRALCTAAAPPLLPWPDLAPLSADRGGCLPLS